MRNIETRTNERRAPPLELEARIQYTTSEDQAIRGCILLLKYEQIQVDRITETTWYAADTPSINQGKQDPIRSRRSLGQWRSTFSYASPREQQAIPHEIGEP
jgi:hypothetical protein